MGIFTEFNWKTKISELINRHTASVQSINAELENINKSIADIGKTIYPVGSIYISVNNTNPATLFGGTWVQIQERFLLSCGNTHAAGTTGGEFTHTLTVNEMPSHGHTAWTGGAGGHDHSVTDNVGDVGDFPVTTGEGFWMHGTIQSTHDISRTTNWVNDHSHTVTVNNNGSGYAHNVTPPYLAVYMWKRTA